MINPSKLALVAAVALASAAAPALAHTVHHRHRHAPRTVYNYRPNPALMPPADPVDDPALTGGGSLGFNKCGGHPAC